MTAVVARPTRLRRELAVLVSGTAVGQLAIVASTPIISRLFSPREVGAFGAFSALESILVVVACLRLEQAVLLARTSHGAARVVRAGLWSAVGVSAGVGVVAGAAPSGWFGFAGADVVPWFAGLLAVTLLVDAAGQLLGAAAMRTGDVADVARSRGAVGVTQATGQTGLGLAGTGGGGLVAGYLAGRAAGLVPLVRHWARQTSTPLAGADDEPVHRDLWRYPVLLAPAALLNAAALQVPLLLVGARYDPAVLGALVLANRLTSAPVQLGGQSLSQSLAPRLAERRAAGRDLRPVVRDVATRMAVVGVGLALPLLLLGPAVATRVLGDDWELAGRFVQLLAVPMAAQLVASPLAIVLVAQSRQALQLAWDAVRLVAVVGAILLPAAAGWSATGAVAALAGVLTPTYAALVVLVWWACRHPGDAPGAQLPS